MRREKASTRAPAGLARALGPPARIRIVRMLIAQPACAGWDAGIVTGEIEHPRVCYSFDALVLQPLRELLATAASLERPRPSRRA